MIRHATKNDIPGIAAINRLSFGGNKPEGTAEKWITNHMSMSDAYHYFVAEENGMIVGYISWEIKGGFARAVPVLELEQLAVHPDYRGQGIGRALIAGTFATMKQWIKKQQADATQLRVFVWTKKDNVAAQAIYQSIAQRTRGSRNIFGGTDELMLVGEHTL